MPTVEIPLPANPPPGCPFAAGCQYVIKDICQTLAPPMRRFDDGHGIACHLPAERLRAMEPAVVTTAAELAAAAISRPAPFPAKRLPATAALARHQVTAFSAEARAPKAAND